MTRAILVAAVAVSVATAQQTTRPLTELPRPRGYVAGRAASPIVVDGKVGDVAWQRAPWTDAFVDIEGDLKPKPPLNTQAKMLWDDKYFYVAATLEETHLWSEITERDAVIFHENDFEVFIDPDADSHEYYEFEINARGTFWDLFLPMPYRAGGHAVDSWDIHGMRSAVHLDGTLNNPRDMDRSWTVELAFPWAAFSRDERHPSIPKNGDQWRVNFSRVQWPLDAVDQRPEAVAGYRKKPGVNEHNWVWSPQHLVDMHRPERWGYVQFSSDGGSLALPTPFVPDVSWTARQWLQDVYEAEREFQKTHNRYASTFVELGIAPPAGPLLAAAKLTTTPSLFEATVELRTAGNPAVIWHIRQDARVWRN